jgi:hypothetical protein
MKAAAFPIVFTLLGGCAGESAVRHVTLADFERYKKDCAAPDAYLIEGKERGVTFKGVSLNQIERAQKAACLTERLKGTDVRFIGFLSMDRSSAPNGS